MMMNPRNRSPFTASQWQELEHQALIFKYMVSGIPIPPDLIFTVKRSLDSSMSSRLFSHQPIGLGCFQAGFGRKSDPEPGRCRRTDGKKWRCSKEAHPDSKYCERHMHRGKNRSRKPVEITTSTNPSPSISSITTASSSLTSETHLHHHFYNNNNLVYPSLYPHSSSSRPPLSPQSSNTHHFFDSGSYSQTDKEYRCLNGVKGGVDERAFFGENSGTVRSLHDSYTPLTMNSTRDYSDLNFQSLADHESLQRQEDQHCFVLGTDFKSARSIKEERGEETQKPFHHFFGEWPPKDKDSWFDIEDSQSSHASFSATQLSISMPLSTQELFQSKSRPY